MMFSKKRKNSAKSLITKPRSYRQLKGPDYQKAVSALLTLFLLFQTSGASAAPAPDWYNTSWDYRRVITIDNTGDANELTNYQIQVTLDSSNFDFSRARTDKDIRFIDSDGNTLLQPWIRSYDSSGQIAIIWPKIPSIPAYSTKTIYMYYGNPNIDSNSYIIYIDSTTHNDYGLAYPITYEFSIPSGSSDLKAYKSYTEAENWTQIAEKTSSDFFNGIEAVRFDYSNNRAYISVAFSDASDEIHLKVTDSSDQSLDISYQGIPDYYDNRDAVVVATADDWDGYGSNNTGFKKACDAFTSRKIWLTPGITTQGVRKYNWPPVSWSEVQPKIDAGYIEVASHSREHLGETYSYRYTGHHTGADNEQYTLTNCEVNFPTDSPPYTRNLVGWIIENTTDGSAGTITSSTAKTVTCSAGLSGGTDNDWDTGDTYLIDRHDEEIGDSKTEIINNLDLPALNKKGSQEYVYAWIEPFGLTNPTITTKLGQYKYLADRDTSYDCVFAWWDSLNGVFNRIGTSLLVDYSNLTAANNQFDAVISAGNIYHMYMHPKDVNWATGSWVQQHLDYIKEKPNLWYVGFGHLYLYHYIDDQNKVSVAKTGEGDNSISYPVIYDDFPGATLDTEYWSEKINGGSGTVTVSSGNCTLDPQNNVTNSAAIKSTQSGFIRLKSRFKSTTSNYSYIDLSLGSGGLVGINGPTSWWHTTFYNGYVVMFQSDSSVKLIKMTNGSATTLDMHSTSVDILNFHEYELIISDSGVRVERDGDTILSSSDTTYTSGYGLIAGGEYSNGWGDTTVIDWVKLYKQQYTNPEPSTSVGLEESLYLIGNPGMRRILHQWWAGITGTTVSSLTSDPNYPDNPSGSQLLTSFEGPTNWADNYGTRISGYLHPPADGNYKFWIASDNDSELWLSTDSDPNHATKIAYVLSGYTNPREWDKYPSQRSAEIPLATGQKYYIEALHKEDTGSDNLAVAWEGPGISQQVIDGNYLSSWWVGLYGDFTDNNIVDMRDFSEFLEYWLEDNCNETAGVDLDGNCIINFYEFSALANNWLQEP